jgi:5-methylcytosine-specific restriction endonuclease McrA
MKGQLGFFEEAKKRTLGIRDKQILYHRAKGKCEACNKKIGFDEMHSGHKTAASKGGSATLRNSVCLCMRCNKLQGTDSWSTFMRKMGKANVTTVTSGKKRKKNKNYHYETNLFGERIKVSGKKEKGLFDW